MTTSSVIREAWQTNVFEAAAIQDITPKIYDYDITQESMKEIAKLLHETKVNCISYLVTRAQRLRAMGQIEQTFDVAITYMLEYDTDGESWKACADAFETIDSQVITALGGTWDSTVDYYRLQSAGPIINLQQVGGRSVWVGRYTYQGFKNL